MKNLPPLLLSFIRSVTPAEDRTPLAELKQRYADRREEERRKLFSPPPNYPHGSIEFMVELRIRDWVRRMEAEKAEFDRIRKQDDGKKPDSAAPPHIRPPAP